MSWEVQQGFDYDCHTIHRCNISWIKEFKFSHMFGRPYRQTQSAEDVVRLYGLLYLSRYYFFLLQIGYEDSN